jgi:UPF0755 protein
MSEHDSVRRLAAMGLASVLFFMAMGGFWAALGVWLFLRLPGSAEVRTVRVDITPGMSALAIADRLHGVGAVSDPHAFYWLCRYRSAANRIQAGEYEFSAPLTPDQVLNKLVQGKVVLHRVTLLEGSTIRDVASLLDQAGLARESEISSLARDADFIQSLGMAHPSLEGYLFPETYHHPRHQSARNILRAMVQQFRQHFTEEMAQRGRELGMSVHQVVILASMVEKEAAVDEERPLVAAVFLNRLQKGMPLQSDPTAVYDMEDFSGPILSGHLKRQSPYNTYQVRGLPIGPICNPGLRSLEAVLRPARVPYLYFVSNLDGTHRFSSTLSEHQEAVSQYREKSRKPPGNGEGSSAAAGSNPADDSSKPRAQEP